MAFSTTIEISTSFGALLIGGLSASLLSGFTLLQTLLYFRLYPGDSVTQKSLVGAVCSLDTAHTAFVWTSLWSYLIGSFGSPEGVDDIHWSVALTIVTTAILTFLVHLFFADRIYKLSHKNLWLTTPITNWANCSYMFQVALALLRLVSAAVTTGAMLHLGTFSRFKQEIRWVFTTGLALSTCVDILITGSLFVLLHMSRVTAGKDTRLNAVIDSLIRYAFETGFLTCTGTVISMLCWLTMSNNLVFLGLHFSIGKLYANSLLVTLNMREMLRRARPTGSDGMEYVPQVHILDSRRRRPGATDTLGFNFDLITKSAIDSRAPSKAAQNMEVNVETSVQYHTAE